MSRIPILLCLLLSACDTGAMHRTMACRSQAGPEPYPMAGLGGIAGLMAENSTPEGHAWNERVNECVREARR
jgi:hypothetical protein